MKKIVLTVLILLTASFISFAGNCDAPTRALLTIGHGNVQVTSGTYKACPGSQVHISVDDNASGGQCNKRYQWYKDGVLVSGWNNNRPDEFAASTSYSGTYYVIVTNSEGSIRSNSVTLWVGDDEAPQFSNIPQHQYFCPSSDGNYQLALPTVNDNCDNHLSISYSPTTFNSGTTSTVTFSSTDASNNTASCTGLVTIYPEFGATLSGSSFTKEIWVDIGDMHGYPLSGYFTIVYSSSNSTSIITVSNYQTGTRISVLPGDYQLVSVTNANGCSVSYTTADVITIEDIVPVANCKLGLTVYLSNPNLAIADVAADGCVGDLSISKTTFDCSDAANGGSDVILTATYNGVSASCTSFVVVVDDVNPSITCPGNITVNNDAGECGAIVSFTVTATDNCGEPTISSSPASGSFFPIGITIVTSTATDASNNTKECTFSVTVTDNEAPVITCPANITVNTDNGVCYATVSGATLGSASATDNCGIQSISSNASSNNVYLKGLTTVTWTATDVHGNQSTCTQTVTVIDNEAPVINCPSNITVNTDAGHCYATVSSSQLGSATATDNCDQPSISNNAPSQFLKGTTNVTWSAVDAQGNKSTCVQTVTVIDNEAPVINCPSNITVNTDAGHCYATVSSSQLGSATATDNCDQPSISNNAPSQFQKGTTNVTWSAVDAQGNKSTCVQTVTVEDHESPTLTINGLSPNVLWPPDHRMVTITANYTVSDNCSATVTASATSNEPDNGLGDGDTPNDIQISNNPLCIKLRAERSGTGNGRIYTVTLTATDGSGNYVTRTATVSVPKSQGKKRDGGNDLSGNYYSEILSLYPNPAINSATITFALANEGNTTVSVYNQLGSLVKVLANESMTSDVYSLVWDTKDSYGNPVVNGVYTIRISNGSENLVQSVVVSR